MNRNPATKIKFAQTGKVSFAARGIFVIFLAIFPLLGCNAIKQATKPNPADVRTPGQNPPPTTTSGPANATAGQRHGPLSGYWQLGFMLNNNTYTSHVRIVEHNMHFQGEGTDDKTNKAFKIEQGSVANGKVLFYKRYDNPNTKDETPVEYTGTIDMSGVPYMMGDFVVQQNGRELTGKWEAQLEKKLDGGDASSSNNQPPPQQAPPPKKDPPPQQTPAVKPPSGRAPDLSGKWNCGFEYRFKNIHSTMWLEQYGGNKIRGHGIDRNTKEKFVIEKGWYSFPKVTLIRKYPGYKGKKGSVPGHTMTFKALVEWVQSDEYQGPYMKGKTDGGGNWEAELVR